jgi:hypothetical protein
MSKQVGQAGTLLWRSGTNCQVQAVLLLLLLHMPSSTLKAHGQAGINKMQQAQLLLLL